MFGFGGYQRSNNPFEQTGSIELHADCYRQKRPLWLVALKVLGVAAMIGVGSAIAVPTLLEFEFPLWQAIAYTAGAMALYVVIAFFIRPEANTDNMGLGGGMGNDPFKSSDNVNRFLWNLHCALGPGRFTSETFLDVCVCVGLLREEDEAQPTSGYVTSAGGYGTSSGGFDATQPIEPLDPNRFALSSAGSVADKIRDSQRYGANPPAAAR